MIFSLYQIAIVGLYFREPRLIPEKSHSVLRSGSPILKGADGNKRRNMGKDKEKALEYSRAWKRNNRDRYLAYQRLWNNKNRDKIRAYGAKWRATHRDKIRADKKAWDAANPSKLKIHRERRRERLRGGVVSKWLWLKLLVNQKYKCAYCETHLSKAKYHKDHIYPVSRGGMHSNDNIQLLCVSCNLRKYNKDPVEFMIEMGLLPWPKTIP